MNNFITMNKAIVGLLLAVVVGCGFGVRHVHASYKQSLEKHHQLVQKKLAEAGA